MCFLSLLFFMHLFESGNLPLFVAKLGDFISSAKRLDRQSFVWGMFFLLFAAMSIVYQTGLLSLTLSVTLSLPFFTLDDKPLLSIIRPCWKERDFPLRSLVVTRGPKWRNSRPVFSPNLRVPQYPLIKAFRWPNQHKIPRGVFVSFRNS